jgi:Xaa-Pro aminopeptidase
MRQRGEGASVLVVSSVTNVEYLTGFTGDSSVLVLTDHRQIVVSDGRFEEQLGRECPDLERHIRPRGQPLAAGVAGVVAGLGAPAAAFEAAHLTVADYETLRDAAPSIEWRASRGWVEGLRRIKDGTEIAKIRGSAAIAEAAFQTLLSRLRIDGGMTEKSLADDLDALMRSAGATSAAFPTIVAAGANAALPHARPSRHVRIDGAIAVLFDWGAVAQSYRSDLTRMIVTAKFTPQFEQVYRSVLVAQDRAISAVRPGCTAHEIDGVARRVLEDAGYGDRFTHGLGHGIGLEIHESPFLGRDPDVELEPGMVLTVEPGVYIPGWGGVRIEDDVLVTENGAEVLTRLPKDLESVRLVR